MEIPLPDESEGQPVTLETVEFSELDIPEDGGEVLVAEGETYVVTDTAEGDPDIPVEGMSKYVTSFCDFFRSLRK